MHVAQHVPPGAKQAALDRELSDLCLTLAFLRPPLLGMLGPMALTCSSCVCGGLGKDAVACLGSGAASILQGGWASFWERRFPRN